MPTDTALPTALSSSTISPPTLPTTAVATLPTATSTPSLPTHTPEPTPTAHITTPDDIEPLPTATTPPASAITYFSANVKIADPGDTIQFTWDTVNSDRLTLYRLLDYRLSSSWDVAASGVMSYTIGENERNSITFMLFAGRDGVDESAQATVTIALTCPDSWFF